MLDIDFLLRNSSQAAFRADRKRPAFSIAGGGTWSHEQLAEQVDRYAAGLLTLGVRPSDRIAILLHNELVYPAVYLAIVRLRAVAVRLNWRLAGEELAYALVDSGCRVLCFHDTFAPTIDTIRSQVPVEFYVDFATDQGAENVPPCWAIAASALGGSPNALPGDVARPEELAMIMYTSGTTGRPKGAMWTHANTMAVATMQVMHWHYDEHTVAMTTGPMYHVGGWEDLLLPALLVRGHAVAMSSRSFDMGRLLTTLEQHRVTDAFLFPAMVAALPKVPGVADADLSGLRRILTGGSPIAPRALRDLRALLPDVALTIGYGLTEGGAVVTLMNDEEAEAHPDSVGRPVPLVEIRITGEDGAEIAAEADGEIWVRSPSVSVGYWNRPEATAETFVDGWCRTGDIGRWTDGGFLRITGRKKDMIRTGQENVYPAEIEAILSDHERVADVAVVGVPDPIYDEAICAVVVPIGELRAEDVVEYARSRLAGYKRPRHVVFMDELPRNASGKVLKYQLQQHYADIAESQGHPFSESNPKQESS